MFDIIMFWLTASFLTYMTLLGPYVLILMFLWGWLEYLTGESRVEKMILGKIEKIVDVMFSFPLKPLGGGGPNTDMTALEGCTIIASILWIVVSLCVVAGMDNFSGDISSRYVDLISIMSTWSATYLGWLGLPLVIFIGASFLYKKGVALYIRFLPTINKIDALTKEKTDV